MIKSYKSYPIQPFYFWYAFFCQLYLRILKNHNILHNEPLSSSKKKKKNPKKKIHTMAEETTPKPEVGASGRKIIYDKDGKPCRSCNTLLDFQMVTGKIVKPAVKDTYREDPPDVEKLGNSSWTFIHALCSKYPENPTPEDKREINGFFNVLSRMYPCTWCADDFKKYLKEHPLDNKDNEGLNKWLCGAHNEVNKKLGKKEFDCDLWKKRWRDGWD